MHGISNLLTLCECYPPGARPLNQAPQDVSSLPISTFFYVLLSDAKIWFQPFLREFHDKVFNVTGNKLEYEAYKSIFVKALSTNKLPNDGKFKWS